MTERQLEMLNNDFRYLAGIVHLQTTDKTLLATKFRVSWPTMQKKVTNLLKAGIIVDKGDSYKINPDILATSLFIGIYSDGISINCIALNLAQETVELSEVLSKENYDSFIAIIHNTNLSLLSKITFLIHLFSQEDKILNVGISIQGTITSSKEIVISNSYLSLNSSSFLDKCTLFEAVRANYYMLKSDHLLDDMWYLYVGNDAIYLLSNDTISPAKGLITLDTCEKKAISTLFKHNTDQISLFEAKDIVLHKIIPFMQFVHPSILIVGVALASQDVSSFVYSDFKALNISEVKFDDSNFAKSIACFAMSKFFEGRE
jgi:hypothetical protein